MQKEIYLAAGCFWGAEHFFKQIDGVTLTQVGFANGHTANPTYQEVYTDTTGFAETVRVTYDEKRIGLPELTALYFTIINPLSLNKQGGDIGTRYRTGVYYKEEADKALIQPVFEAESRRVGAPLVVELEPLRNFYLAEERHQDYLDKNPEGYCHLPLELFEMAKRANR